MPLLGLTIGVAAAVEKPGHVALPSRVDKQAWEVKDKENGRVTPGT